MKDKQKKVKPHVFLMTIASVLYLFAVLFLVAGIVEIFDNDIINIGNIENSYGEIEFEFDMNFEKISYFTNAAVLFIWGTVLMLISKLIKRNAKHKEKDETSMMTERMPYGMQEQQEHKKEYVLCAYCDNQLNENDRKCPYCGASKKVRKKSQ